VDFERRCERLSRMDRVLRGLEDFPRERNRGLKG